MQVHTRARRSSYLDVNLTSIGRDSVKRLAHLERLCVMDKSSLLAHIRTFRQQVMSELDRLEDALISLGGEPQTQTMQEQDAQSKDDWLTAQEVCKCLKIGLSTLHRNIKAGVLPQGVEFSPRAIRWRMSDIVAYQKRRCSEESSRTPTKKRGRPSRVMKIGAFMHV